MEFDLDVLQELPAHEDEAGLCGWTCAWTCAWTAATN